MADIMRVLCVLAVVAAAAPAVHGALVEERYYTDSNCTEEKVSDYNKARDEYQGDSGVNGPPGLLWDETKNGTFFEKWNLTCDDVKIIYENNNLTFGCVEDDNSGINESFYTSCKNDDELVVATNGTGLNNESAGGVDHVPDAAGATILEVCLLNDDCQLGLKADIAARFTQANLILPEEETKLFFGGPPDPSVPSLELW